MPSRMLQPATKREVAERFGGGERPFHEATPVFPQEGPRVGGSGVTSGHGITR